MALTHPLAAGAVRLRDVILDADGGITEHVKWTAPSLCAEGVDPGHVQPAPRRQAQLVFHRGAQVNTPRSLQLRAAVA